VDTEADLRAAHLVTTESFAEHWGTAPRTYNDWIALQRSRPGHDESLWSLAELDGEPVGVCLMDRSREPMGYGYVAVLGVRPRARRQGIADILLRTAIAASCRRGLRGTELIVDSGNTTGAGKLYERAGMREYRAMEVWLRPIMS
jgi:ribosomal protein S18 acetylase RimI-like enzyme